MMGPCKWLGAAAAVGLVLTPMAADAQSRHDRNDRREQSRGNVALGIGLGLVGGALLSNGDPWATIAGAAAGGVIAKAATDDDRNRRPEHWDRRNLRPDDRRNRPDDRRYPAPGRRY